jgi:hypothetical protein
VYDRMSCPRTRLTRCGPATGFVNTISTPTIGFAFGDSGESPVHSGFICGDQSGNIAPSLDTMDQKSPDLSGPDETGTKCRQSGFGASLGDCESPPELYEYSCGVSALTVANH